MSESTIIITSSDLVEHAVLSRKKHETLFRRDYLVRNGAAPADQHVTALESIVREIDAKLSPIEDKLKHIDLLTIVPGRAEITRLTDEVNHYARADLDSAMKNRSGPVFELLKQRALLTKGNYERRDDIARLTVLVNTLPRSSGEGVRAIVESESQDEVDVSSLSAERQQELVNLLGRLSRIAFVFDNRLCLDKKKVDGLTFVSWPGEVRRSLVGGQEVWIPKEKAADWDSNEAVFKELGNRIIVKTHEKQVKAFSEDEQAEFDRLQHGYIAAKEKRMQIMPSLAELQASLPRVEQKAKREDVQQMDI